MSAKTLGQLGEFKIIAEIIRPTLDSVAARGATSDDCASVEIPTGARAIVISTDVAPRPLVWNYDPNPYWTWGWYSVAIGISDLSAGGVRPFAFANSVEAPPELPAHDLQNFFSGVAEACRSARLVSVGGNLKSAPSFSCHGTVFGITEGSPGLRRRGCTPGDLIVSIGACGRFISAFLKLKTKGLDALSEEDRVALFRPTSPIEAMKALHSAGLVRAASDNSDGLLGAVWNVLEASDCGVRLELRSSDLDPFLIEIASENGIDPWNLFFFWGDWQTVTAVAEKDLECARELVKPHAIEFRVLGRATPQTAGLTASVDGKVAAIRILRNEDFSEMSYSNDADDHVTAMLTARIFDW